MRIIKSFVMAAVSLLAFESLTSADMTAMSLQERMRVTQKNPASVDIREQPERELSEDELRMKERLIALSRGEGDVADLRVELNDGDPVFMVELRVRCLNGVKDGKAQGVICAD